MSTHAIVAYHTGKLYVSKCAHHGHLADYQWFIAHCTPAEYIESVNKGDSSNPLAGFYCNEAFCKRILGWDHEMWEAQLEFTKPKTDRRFKDFMSNVPNGFYAYVLNEERTKVTVYMKHFDGAHHKCAEIDLSNSDGCGATRLRFVTEFKRLMLGSWQDATTYKELDGDKIITYKLDMSTHKIEKIGESGRCQKL